MLPTVVRPALLASLLMVAACGGEARLRVVPDHGRQSGGQGLRIEGHDFVGHGAPVVYLDDRAAKMVVVESDRLITVTTPQTDDPRTVDVLIRFEDGTEHLLPAAFTYEEEQGIVLQPEIGGG
jgi:hypothetical protein